MKINFNLSTCQLVNFSIALLFLCSCSSDDNEQATRRPLIVEVTENAIVPEGGAASPSYNPQQLKAAAPTTTASLRIFYMNYERDQYNVEKGGDNWGSLTWPKSVSDNTKIDFYAYSDGTFYYNDGNTYVNFTVDENVAAQKDLLVATHKQIAFSDTDGKVSLTFDHACAAVQFYIAKTTAVADKSITVTSIVLQNVKNQGDYYYNTDTHWANLTSANSYYTLTNGDIPLTTSYQQLPCNYLYMIPQAKSGMTLEISYAIDGVAKTKTLSLGTDEWQAGTEYRINIKVGTSFIKDTK